MPDYIYYDLVNAAIGAHRAYMNTEYFAACQHFKALRDDLLKQARARITSDDPA
ncbi:hypothetical protein D3C80_2041360 [compost metagenome]